MSTLGDEFTDPPWDAPLDAEAVIARIPPDATMKGVFLDAIVQRARQAGVQLASARPSYVAFRDYALREHCEILVEVARALWPDESLRQGLRRIGRGAPHAVIGSMVGRVTVGVAEGPLAVVQAMAKTYTLLSSPGTIDVVEHSSSHVVLHMRRIHHFLDSHHVGVYEGALRFARAEDARVLIRARSSSDADLLCRWRAT